MLSFRSVIVLSTLAASTAWAAPVVSPGGKPGAAASWKSEGGALVLRLAPGYDAAAVAKAIQTKVQGTTAKVLGDTITVSGMADAKLLSALESVDAGEASGLDDVDAMLSNLRNPSESDEESGSSIRATQAADFSAVMGKKDELITAKVLEVKHQKFPLVLVTLKVSQMPKGLTLPGVKNGAKITVLPRVKSKSGVVDPADETSQLNLGAWYVEAGDTVWLRLEKEPQDNVWVAAAFDRRVK
jgi:hypothetical protein